MSFYKPLLVLLVLSSAAQTIQRPSLRDQVRQHGNLEYMVMAEYSPADLDEIVARADTILAGSIQQVRSFLHKDETGISTDYLFTIENVLKSATAQRVSAGETVTVRRPSGVVTIEGYAVRATENDFPPFDQGDRYVLFLKRDGDVYTVPYGGQGAFKLTESGVFQLSKTFGKWNEERGPVSLAEFLELVRSYVSR